MSGTCRIDLGIPALLAFSGPDTVRFLNGQLTQDVRKVTGGELALPSCVTDAKGKLQFRVTLALGPEDCLWISGLPGNSEDLEARLTRYLIADDTEAVDLTGRYALWHFTGEVPVPEGVVARKSQRYGLPGMDWWVPAGTAPPAEIPVLEGNPLETLRIANGIPAWGTELTEGMLPPEAALEETDISYNKGCYIGQEVISRIKSAGKVNRKLARFIIGTDSPVEPGELVDSGGKPSGEITSVSPEAGAGGRAALGFVRRGAGEFLLQTSGGMIAVRLC